jgi:hypothetical protein
MRLSSLCFLLALAGAPGLAAAEPGDPSPPTLQASDAASLQAWARQNLDTDGWVLIGTSSEGQTAIAWYVADQSAPGSKHPLFLEWVRGENARQTGSILARWEVDCTSGRSREVERVFYQGNNLRGAATLVGDNQGARMAPPPKNSIAESVIKRVCRDAG